MEVSGVVLTIGEDTVGRAIESLKKQTVPCKDIVIVKNVSPFHKALNKAVAKVKTPFFIQCDADMVLDPDCIETMLKFMKKDTGIVIGLLQDELLGIIQAVKLFRTECVSSIKFADHVSPDTHYIRKMTIEGWQYAFANRKGVRFSNRPRDVFGDHKPNYTSLYTFEKFRLEGARILDRGVFSELNGYLKKFSNSTHPMAPVALIGLCQGLFSDIREDRLTKYKASKEFRVLERFMNSCKTDDPFMISKQ